MWRPRRPERLEGHREGGLASAQRREARMARKEVARVRPVYARSSKPRARSSKGRDQLALSIEIDEQRYLRREEVREARDLSRQRFIAQANVESRKAGQPCELDRESAEHELLRTEPELPAERLQSGGQLERDRRE